MLRFITDKNTLAGTSAVISNNTLKRGGTALLLFLVPLFVCAQLTFHTSKNNPMRKLQFAEMLINNVYVDSVDETKLVEDGIRGMLKGLDPHSSYMTPDEAKAMQESLEGDFDGIGVQFNIINDSLVVIQPTLNGPSEKRRNPSRRPHRVGQRHAHRRCEDTCGYHHQETAWKEAAPSSTSESSVRE